MTQQQKQQSDTSKTEVTDATLSAWAKALMQQQNAILVVERAVIDYRYYAAMRPEVLAWLRSDIGQLFGAAAHLDTEVLANSLEQRYTDA